MADEEGGKEEKSVGMNELRMLMLMMLMKMPRKITNPDATFAAAVLMIAKLFFLLFFLFHLLHFYFYSLLQFLI